jgi:putative sigma-54 modulation protein
MQVQVTGQHVVITPGLRSFIVGKLSRLEEIFPRVKKVAAVITVEKYRHTAEIHFHAEGVEMSAKKTTKDMYASIEQAVAALEQQAGKRKDRLHTSGALRRGASKVEKKTARKNSRMVVEREEAPVSKAKVVRVRATAQKPMSVEDAVSLLADSKESFVLFTDALSGQPQVLFRRDDGSLGLMEA